MSTITKEWLQKAIRQHESMSDEIPFGLDEDDSNTLAALRIALASLETESVAYAMADDLKDSSIISTPAYRDLGEAMERTVGDVVALYTAPPAPVALPSGYSDFEEIWSSSTHPLTQDDEMKDFAWDIWNACRASMLQGAEPVSQPYTLPADVIDALEKALQAMSFMGDTLNALDAVCEEDVEYVTPAFEAVREVLEGAEPVPGWIPCSERMPEEIGRYWCYVEEQNSLGKSHYQWNCSWNGELWGGEMMYGRVTHWMPLQEPPKQTSES